MRLYANFFTANIVVHYAKQCLLSLWQWPYARPSKNGRTSRNSEHLLYAGEAKFGRTEHFLHT